MSFSDNHIVIPNPLTTAANSIAEEATSTGLVEYVAPCNMDVEEFGVLVAVTLGNTITTSSGYALCRVIGATEEVLEILKLTNNTNGIYAGDGTHNEGGTVAAATTAAFAAKDIIMKRMTGDSHFFPQGSIIRMRGTTTAGSATGDVVPFVIARMAGKGFKLANVYNEGALTINA
jgi:hypothetical protein